MPKMKTVKAAKKRFKRTATGKFKRAKAGKQHKTAKKTPKQRRSLRKNAIVDKTNQKQIERMLPYS